MDEQARIRQRMREPREAPPPGFEYVRGSEAEKAIAWLADARVPFRLTPAGLAGRGFGAYVRVDYPLIEELLNPDELLAHYHEQHPYPKSAMERTQHEQILGRLLLGGTDASFAFRRLRLHELAARLHIPYSAHIYTDLAQYGQILDNRIWPLPLGIHETWEMPLPTVRRLARLLQPYSAEGACYFDWEESRNISFLPTPWTPSEHGRTILRAQLDDVANTIVISDHLARSEAPDLWWPANHKWVLSSDFEHCGFAVVAGPRRLIDSILADPFLDTIEVDPELDLDSVYQAGLHIPRRE